MKGPKVRNTYCPKCGKHTAHSVSLYRKGRDRLLAQGNRRSMIRKRRGYGGQRDPRQRKLAKTTKKQTFMFRCQTCGYTTQSYGLRVRKLELTT
ncbi:MAG: 50S ribosomal protein L44e [Candidatus Bathyarchaeia archaeon]